MGLLAATLPSWAQTDITNPSPHSPASPEGLPADCLELMCVVKFMSLQSQVQTDTLQVRTSK